MAVGNKDVEMLFAPSERETQIEWRDVVANTGQVWRERMVDTARVRRNQLNEKWSEADTLDRVGYMLKLGVALLTIAFGISLLWGAYHKVDQLLIMQEYATDGWSEAEFNPSLGAEVESQNGRVLFIVHRNYGEDGNPIRYENNSEYQDYLRKLQARENYYLDSGDVVVNVVEFGTFAESENVAKENVLYHITDGANGMSYLTVVEDGIMYEQNVGTLFEMLRDAGITDVEISGEFRGKCAMQVADKMENAGFDIEWCQDCVFPQIGDDEVDKYDLAPETFGAKPVSKSVSFARQNTAMRTQAKQWR